MTMKASLLDDLLPAGFTPKKKGLLDDLLPPSLVPQRAKYVAPWKPDALIILLKEKVCAHCGSTHLEPNPFLLLREISPTGAIKESAKPNSILPADITDLPIEQQTIPAGSIPFCLECLEEETLPLRKMFLAQQGTAKPTTTTVQATPDDLDEDLDDLDDDFDNLMNNL